MARVYGGDHLGLARIGARIYDLKGKGCDIRSWRDLDQPTLWWYQMAKPKPKGYEVITDRETGKVLRRVPVYG